jgi:HK97 family phage prohead protease
MIDTKAAPAQEHGAFFELDTKSVQEDGTFVGYASIFGLTDLGRDIVQAGAFAASLKVRPASKVKMLRGHDTSEPIGVWTELVEDTKGLKATGRLILETTRGRETYALLKAGALDGLSIGYKTVKDKLDRKSGTRLLEAVDLHEVSITTFPMLPQAIVTRVKNSGTDFSRLIRAINAATAAIA